MRKFVFLVIVLLLGLLQVTILDWIKLFNLKPDLLLISVVIAALFFNLRWALFFSLFAGIFKDAFATLPFGINTFLFVLWALCIVRLSRQISLEENLLRLVLIFVIALLQNIITGLALVYSGNFIALGIFLRIVLLGSLYTAVAFALVSRIIKPVYA